MSSVEKRQELPLEADILSYAELVPGAAATTRPAEEAAYTGEAAADLRRVQRDTGNQLIALAAQWSTEAVIWGQRYAKSDWLHWCVPAALRMLLDSDLPYHIRNSLAVIELARDLCLQAWGDSEPERAARQFQDRHRFMQGDGWLAEHREQQEVLQAVREILMQLALPLQSSPVMSDAVQAYRNNMPQDIRRQRLSSQRRADAMEAAQSPYDLREEELLGIGVDLPTLALQHPWHPEAFGQSDATWLVQTYVAIDHETPCKEFRREPPARRLGRAAVRGLTRRLEQRSQPWVYDIIQTDEATARADWLLWCRPYVESLLTQHTIFHSLWNTRTEFDDLVREICVAGWSQGRSRRSRLTDTILAMTSNSPTYLIQQIYDSCMREAEAARQRAQDQLDRFAGGPGSMTQRAYAQALPIAQGFWERWYANPPQDHGTWTNRSDLQRTETASVRFQEDPQAVEAASMNFTADASGRAKNTARLVPARSALKRTLGSLATLDQSRDDITVPDVPAEAANLTAQAPPLVPSDSGTSVAQCASPGAMQHATGLIVEEEATEREFLIDHLRSRCTPWHMMASLTSEAEAESDF